MPEVAYPTSLKDLEARFATEAECRGYLWSLRWPDGFTCPSCGGGKGWPVREARLMECATCGHQTSLTAGTIFDNTKTPLRIWFRAAWLMTSSRAGVNAVTLQEQLGFRSYETAWAWLHKFRRAMVRPGRDRLSGTVEVDETFVGGEAEGGIGRQTNTKCLVGVAAEARGAGIGRIRLATISDASQPSLEGFVKSVVAPGSTVHTDAWSGYVRLGGEGYTHTVSNVARSGQQAHELLPRVHLVAGLLKRWLLGTHQGGQSMRHLNFYLDEFTFRFNRRRSGNRGKLFARLLEQAVALPPAPLHSLVGGILNPSQTQA
jgi:transposase-like protein